MSKFLLWRSVAKWKAGDVPTGAVVAVGIADQMEVDGELLISSHLMSEREVDEAIDTWLPNWSNCAVRRRRRSDLTTIRCSPA